MSETLLLLHRRRFDSLFLLMWYAVPPPEDFRITKRQVVPSSEVECTQTISFWGTRGISDFRRRALDCHLQSPQMSLSEPSYARWVFADPTYSSKLLQLVFVTVVGLHPLPAVGHCTAEHRRHPSRPLTTRPRRPVCCIWRSTSVQIHQRTQAIPS
jgi:hypothetical protein